MESFYAVPSSIIAHRMRLRSRDTDHDTRSESGLLLSTAASSEVDEVSKVPGVVRRCGADHDPMVIVLAWRLFLHMPIEVGQEERNGAPDPGKVVVIENDDAAPAQQASKVEEIQEHAVEAMVPIHEREIELAPFREERRQSDLGDLSVVLDEGADASLLEYWRPQLANLPA